MNIGNAADKLFCQEGWQRLALYLFAKVLEISSCTLPKVACFQKFLLTRHEFYGNLSQQFNITYFYLSFRPYGDWTTYFLTFSRYITDWEKPSEKAKA